MPRRTILPLALAAALSLPLAAGPAMADTIKLTIGAGHPLAALWNKVTKEAFMPRFTDRVAKETKHKIEWTEGWGGTICKLGECLEATESGLLDVCNLQVVFEPAKLQAANFSAFVPFTSKDPHIVAKAAQLTYERVPELGKLYEKYNQIALAPGVAGNYGLVTNFIWDKFEDLKGRKIAAAGPNIPWLAGSGAIGVQSNLNEGYTSMQTGVYDAWLIFVEPVRSFRLYEVGKMYTEVNVGFQVFATLTVNRDTWRKLPPEVQKIMKEEAIAWSGAMAQGYIDNDKGAIALLKEKNFPYREIKEEDRVKWAKGLPNIAKQRYEEIKKNNQPAEAIYEYVKALKELGVKLPRDWSAER